MPTQTLKGQLILFHSMEMKSTVMENLNFFYRFQLIQGFHSATLHKNLWTFASKPSDSDKQ